MISTKWTFSISQSAKYGSASPATLVGEAFLDVLEAREDVHYRLRLAGVVEGLTGEQRVHAEGTLGDVEVERTLTELLGEDEVGELRLLLRVLELAVKMDQ